MNNDILIALIEKDSSELNKFFACIDTASISTGYLNLMLDKSRDLSANIASLISNLEAAPSASSLNDGMSHVETNVLDEKISNVVSEMVSTTIMPNLSSIIDERIKDMCSADFVTSKVEELSKSLSDRLQVFADKVSSDVKNLNELVSRIDADLCIAKANQMSVDLSDVPSKCESDVLPAIDAEKLEDTTNTAFDDSHNTNVSACHPQSVEAVQSDSNHDVTNVDTNNECTYQSDDSESKAEAELDDVENKEMMSQSDDIESPEESVSDDIEPKEESSSEVESDGAGHNQPHTSSCIVDSVTSSSKPTLADTIHTRESILDKLSNRVDQSLASSLNNTKIDDLKSVISIADRFRFQRELFSGDGELMNKTITKLNSCASLAEAEEFIQKKFNWSQENQCVADFLHLLQRRYL